MTQDSDEVMELHYVVGFPKRKLFRIHLESLSKHFSKVEWNESKGLFRSEFCIRGPKDVLSVFSSTYNKVNLSSIDFWSIL